MTRTKKASRFGAIVTVGIAFFIAELGDKTQLATIALATKYPTSPLAVLMGTTTGMIIADGFGILVGVVLCRRIPERIIKIVSATVFMVFGVFSTHELFREELAMALLPRMSLTGRACPGSGSFVLAPRPKGKDCGCHSGGAEGLRRESSGVVTGSAKWTLWRRGGARRPTMLSSGRHCE